MCFLMNPMYRDMENGSEIHTQVGLDRLVSLFNLTNHVSMVWLLNVASGGDQCDTVL